MFSAGFSTSGGESCGGAKLVAPRQLARGRGRARQVATQRKLAVEIRGKRSITGSRRGLCGDGAFEADETVLHGREIEFEDAAGVGEAFDDLFVVDFDVVAGVGREADDVGLLGLGVGGLKFHLFTTEVNDGPADFDRGGGVESAILAAAFFEELHFSIGVVEPGGVIFPTAAEGEFACGGGVHGEGEVVVAEAGLVGVGPEEFVDHAKDAPHEETVVDEPPLDELGFLGVGVEGDHGEIGGAGEGGDAEIGVAVAVVEGDAVFVFSGGEGGGVITEDVVGGEFFEVAGCVVAEIDLDAVANGVEQFEERVAVLAGVAIGTSAEGGSDFFAPPFLDEFFEFFFVADDDGGEGAVAHGRDVAFGRRRGEELVQFCR